MTKQPYSTPTVDSAELAELAARAERLLRPADGTGPRAVWAVWISYLHSDLQPLVAHGASRILAVMKMCEEDDLHPLEAIRRVVRGGARRCAGARAKKWWGCLCGGTYRKQWTTYDSYYGAAARRAWSAKCDRCGDVLEAPFPPCMLGDREPPKVYTADCDHCGRPVYLLAQPADGATVLHRGECNAAITAATGGGG